MAPPLASSTKTAFVRFPTGAGNATPRTANNIAAATGNLIIRELPPPKHRSMKQRCSFLHDGISNNQQAMDNVRSIIENETTNTRTEIEVMESTIQADVERRHHAKELRDAEKSGRQIWLSTLLEGKSVSDWDDEHARLGGGVSVFLSIGSGAESARGLSSSVSRAPAGAAAALSNSSSAILRAAGGSAECCATLAGESWSCMTRHHRSTSPVTHITAPHIAQKRQQTLFKSAGGPRTAHYEAFPVAGRGGIAVH